MKIRNLLTTAAIALSSSAMAQQVIDLPSPQQNLGGMSVVQALNTRHSTREFASTPLTPQELSNLCWAACGLTRDDNHRTAPTAMNKQEIRLMAFTTEGVWEYDAKNNKLNRKAEGDHRKLLASNGGNHGFSQDFVLEAPVTLVMVIDFDIFGMPGEKAMQMGCVDAGNVSENINLYCQAAGLVTVPRATMDVAAIRQLLGLTEKQLPIMNNPVGHPKNVDEDLTEIPETLNIPVVIVDGVEVPFQNMSTIDPQDIESINVIKDTDTQEKIGIFAPRCGGIIEVKTKSKKILRQTIKDYQENEKRLKQDNRIRLR